MMMPPLRSSISAAHLPSSSLLFLDYSPIHAPLRTYTYHLTIPPLLQMYRGYESPSSRKKKYCYVCSHAHALTHAHEHTQSLLLLTSTYTLFLATLHHVHLGNTFIIGILFGMKRNRYSYSLRSELWRSGGEQAGAHSFAQAFLGLRFLGREFALILSI